MRIAFAGLAVSLCLGGAIPALADDGSCFDRPGLDTPPCVLAGGQAVLESGLASFERSRDETGVTDTATLLDSLLRYGIGGNSEVRLAIGGYGFQTFRPRDGTNAMRAHGLGDATIGIRHNFSGASGPVAAQAYVTLPIGKTPVGSGDWAAGVLLPVSLDLPGGFGFALTPEVDAAVNSSGSGRHLAYGTAAGLSHALGKAINLGGELAFYQDQDPAGDSLRALAAGEIAWQPAKDWQVDAEVDFGLNAASPRHVFTVGFAHRF